MATENWNSFPSLLNRAREYASLQRRVIEYHIHEQVCRHFGLETKDISDLLSTEDTLFFSMKLINIGIPPPIYFAEYNQIKHELCQHNVVAYGLLNNSPPNA